MRVISGGLLTQSCGRIMDIANLDATEVLVLRFPPGCAAAD